MKNLKLTDEHIEQFNDFVLKKIQNQELNFKDLIDRYKAKKEEGNSSYLCRLLENRELFKKLIENNATTQKELRYAFDKLEDWREIESFDANKPLLRYVVDARIVPFQELVDKYKRILDQFDDPCLWYLLNNNDDFDHWLKNEKLTQEDVKYLLHQVGRALHTVCLNISLIKYALCEFLFDKPIVDKLNAAIAANSWHKRHNIYTIFDLIEYEHKNNEEILKLSELNRQLHSSGFFEFDEQQKLELAEAIKNNTKVKLQVKR